MERRMHFGTEETTAEKNPADLPKIYSKTAILCFSIFFWNLAGGLLLAINLFKLKKSNEALKVLLFSIVFSVAEYYLGVSEDVPLMAIVLFHLIGAAILAQYFYSKYIPDYKSHLNKKIWFPLTVCILLMILLLIIAYFPLLIYYLAYN